MLWDIFSDILDSLFEIVGDMIGMMFGGKK